MWPNQLDSAAAGGTPSAAAAGGTRRTCLSFATLSSARAHRVRRLAAAGPLPAAAPECVGALLAEAEYRGANLSLALRDGGRVVGAWLARLRPDAPVVDLLAIGLSDAHRARLPELIARGCDRARAAAAELAWSPGAAVPALDLASLLAPLGYGPAAPADGAEQRFATLAATPELPDALPLLAEPRLGGQPYQLRAVRCETHWARLEAHWDSLLAATPGATLFQSFAFLRTWWRCFGAARRLWILTVWQGERLLGIAPLQLRAERGLLGRRCVLGFVGELPEVHQPGFLFGAHAQPCTELVLRALEEGLEPWDELDLHEQPADAPLLTQLRERLGARCFFRREPEPPSPYLSLKCSFETYFARCSRGQRQNVRSAQRKLEASGALGYERISDPRELPAALARYRELETHGWKLGHPSSVSAPRRAPFLDALCAELGARGRFQIALLTLDGQPIAGTIGLVHPPHYYHLEITYHGEFAKFSPGMVLEYLELQELFGSGYSEYEFLGGNLEHKLRWVPALREQTRVYVRRRDLGALLQYVWLHGVRPPLRHALERAGAFERARQWHSALRDWLRSESPS